MIRIKPQTALAAGGTALLVAALPTRMLPDPLHLAVAAITATCGIVALVGAIQYARA